MKLTDLKVTEPFSCLFPIDARVLEAIKADMGARGYDQAYPVVAWQEGGNVIVDGNTRYRAAQEIGLEFIPVSVKHFADEDEALAYAIHSQRDRRNLTDADLMRCIAALDRKQKQGESQARSERGTFEPKGPIEPIGRTAEQTAEVVGVSSSKVKRARVVLDHAEPEVKAAVESGEKSIHRAYVETQDKRREAGELPRRKVNKPSADILQIREEGRVSPDFQKAEQSLIGAIQNARSDNWGSTSKAHVIQFLESMLALMKGGE